MSAWSYELVPLPDGREMEVLLHGDHERTFVSFTGTPGGAVPNEQLAKECDEAGLRLVMPLRPGYGRSTPRPGRRVVDFVEDVDAVLQHLGVTEVVCMGGSGGGPHSLAMAAALPQCRAAAVMVSPAPREAEGLDFYDGMALSNQEEWRLIDQGPEAVRPWIVQAAEELRKAGGEMSEVFEDAHSDADTEALAEGLGPVMAASMLKALENGIEGWFEDDFALISPWGFALEDVTTPVTFWTGKQDFFVSSRHSTWMAERVPTADLHIFGAEGHLSVRQHHMPEMLADLLAKAGWSKS